MSTAKRMEQERKESKPKIWLDNYGAGFSASPLEVHSYWNEIVQLEEKSKKFHLEQNALVHKDLYNLHHSKELCRDTNTKKHGTRFS